MQLPQSRHSRTHTAYQRHVHACWEPTRSRIIAALEDQAGPPSLEEDDGDPRWRRLAGKLAGCCMHSQVITRGDGAAVVCESRCKSRLCPRCNYIRSRRVLAKAIAILARCDQPKMLTLTLRSTDDPLRDQITRLTRSFKELRRSKLWKGEVSGGAYVIEVTRNHATGRWHPHLHAIIDANYIAQSALADRWELITEDSRVVDIRAVYSRGQAAQYVAGYVSKSSDIAHLPDHLIPEWAENLHGMRLMQTFGSMHGVKAEEPERDDRDRERMLCWADRLADAAERTHPLAREVLADLLTPENKLPRKPAFSATSPAWQKAKGAAEKLRKLTGAMDEPSPTKGQRDGPTRDSTHVQMRLDGGLDPPSPPPVPSRAERATSDPLARSTT